MMVTRFCLILLPGVAAILPASAAVEPQPLAEGTKDTGIDVLFDSSHQFLFFHHWGCQNALREAGHRVVGNQASLHRALRPGTPMRVRDQSNHAWGSDRPFTSLPAPAFDVVFTYQHSNYQPYLEQERRALRSFVENGGGLVLDGSAVKSPLAQLVEEYGARLLAEPVEVSLRGSEAVPGTSQETYPRKLRVAEFGGEWHLLVGDNKHCGALAWRPLGKGVVVFIAEPQLLHTKVNGQDQVNKEFLSWAVTKAAQGPKQKNDERRVPWEYGGLGGAFYPENEIEVGGVRVVYADNQLPDIIELAKTRFTDVMNLLQKMLPTPPSPGEAFYINLAAGAGGGWAENAITPKMAGTIEVDHNSILSVLAHELAHTMYGPEAKDGTPGCGMPDWWSEAHAGWFQRKVGRELGFGEKWPYFPHSLASADPLLNALDLANVPDGKMGLAWDKAWFIWSLLDARYGQDWYPKWLAHVHRKYNDPKRRLTVDQYVQSVSESLGEDVAPLFEHFGTTLGPNARTELKPLGPRK